MARPKLRGVLLCEDTEHERFFRRLLKRWFARGWPRVERIPDRKGAADAFVVASYAREVRHVRRKRRENWALVAVVDGDRLGMRERLRQLDESLADAGLAKRVKRERIAVFVPTRSIETWELWLCGHRDLDEDTDYKRQHRGGIDLVERAVEAWFRALSTDEKDQERQRLPALAAGRLEVRRLDLG